MNRRAVGPIPAETLPMMELEYLLSYGLLGDFGRFRAARPMICRRGARVVAATCRGLEIAQVLRAASPGHARFLPNTTVGQLLRIASPEDEAVAASLRERAREVLQRGNVLTHELALPLELLDGEILLDGQRGVLHAVRRGECDLRPLVSNLSREFNLHIELVDLSQPAEPAVEAEEDRGCGREGCGSEGGGGGCGSCGSGGGCSTCGSSEKPHAVEVPVAELHAAMDHRHALL